VDHAVAAVLLFPTSIDKDAHPDQEADSQEAAANVYFIGARLRHICILGCNWWYYFYYSLSILDNSASFLYVTNKWCSKPKPVGLFKAQGFILC
jgi:hypothetical protein